ncbi:unnamed protein product, partial [Effrenium voratum]
MFGHQRSAKTGIMLGRSSQTAEVSMAQSGLADEKAPMMGPSSELLELLDTMSKVRMARHILALVGKKGTSSWEEGEAEAEWRTRKEGGRSEEGGR